MSFKRAMAGRELITRGLIIGVVLSSALILSACYHNKQSLRSSQDAVGLKGTNQTSTTGQQSQSQSQETSEVDRGVVISVNDEGFSPVQVSVKSGTNLTYKNTSGTKVQIASDPHPTHTANSEVTEGDFVLEVTPGASATVTLTRTGTWGIHNHLSPGVRAKVVVN